MNKPHDKAPAGLAARRAALSLLDGVLLHGAMLDETRAHGTGTGAEKAEARGLADLTLRRLGQIDDVLSRFVDRAPSGTGQQILRLMAAELLFAGTAPHAAVDLAVRLTRSAKGTGRLAGLVNAVGRRVSEQGPDIVAQQDEAELGMAKWLTKALSKDWGPAVQRAIAAVHLVPAPHDLTLKVEGDIAPLAAETGGAILPTGSLRLPGRPQISALPGFEAGAWWVQDAAAALPVRLLGDLDGKRALDLCAAPGGKTMQLAAAGAAVTALDITPERMERLHQNLTRTGLTAETVVADALTWQPGALFDAIVVDAPCSATGTIRRHPDLAQRTDGKGLDKLMAMQAELMDRAFGWLAPDGVMVYCTCSLLRAEGEGQLRRFLERSPAARLDPIVEADQIPSEFVTKAGALRTRPDLWADRGGLDGFFAARIRRTA